MPGKSCEGRRTHPKVMVCNDAADEEALRSTHCERRLQGNNLRVRDIIRVESSWEDVCEGRILQM